MDSIPSRAERKGKKKAESGELAPGEKTQHPGSTLLDFVTGVIYAVAGLLLVLGLALLEVTWYLEGSPLRYAGAVGLPVLVLITFLVARYPGQGKKKASEEAGPPTIEVNKAFGEEPLDQPRDNGQVETAELHPVPDQGNETDIVQQEPADTREMKKAEKKGEVSPEPPPFFHLSVALQRRGFSLPLGAWRDGIGLDIGTRNLKVVFARRGDPVPVITGWCSGPAPPGSVDKGRILEPEAVGKALRDLLDRNGLRARKVSTSLRGQAVILRTTEFPLMSETELSEALKWEGDRHLPLPAGKAVVDFSILEHSGSRMRVLLAATHRESIEGYLETLRVAGLKPGAIELDPMAQHRALKLSGCISDEISGLAIVDIGASMTNLSIFRGDTVYLTRSIPQGGDDLTQRIAEELSCGIEEAERIKCREGIMGSGAVRATVGPILDGFLDELRRSLEYFLVQEREAGLDRLYLIGGGALLPGLADRLQAYLSEALSHRLHGGELMVIVPRFRFSSKEGSRVDEPEGLAAPLFVTALGLALRGEDKA